MCCVRLLTVRSRIRMIVPLFARLPLLGSSRGSFGQFRAVRVGMMPKPANSSQRTVTPPRRPRQPNRDSGGTGYGSREDDSYARSCGRLDEEPGYAVGAGSAYVGPRQPPGSQGSGALRAADVTSPAAEVSVAACQSKAQPPKKPRGSVAPATPPAVAVATTTPAPVEQPPAPPAVAVATQSSTLSDATSNAFSMVKHCQGGPGRVRSTLPLLVPCWTDDSLYLYSNPLSSLHA